MHKSPGSENTRALALPSVACLPGPIHVTLEEGTWPWSGSDLGRELDVSRLVGKVYGIEIDTRDIDGKDLSPARRLRIA